jgi:uncharacterized alpha/beta hydrolase family protein
MSKFFKIVIALILILLIEAILIYFGYARNRKTDAKPMNTYDKPIIVIIDSY